MSLQAKVLNLLSGITDPMIRMDVSSTIYYLMDVYASGSASEEEVRRSLFEICLDVIRFTRPDLVEEEAREQANKFVDELIAAFRIETLRRRVATSFRSRGLPRV